MALRRSRVAACALSRRSRAGAGAGSQRRRCRSTRRSRTGTLPNGLVYFIRRNPRPANRVLLRLAVQAGSIDEADDQRGLAHMLEHMAFNGTPHFKPGELVKLSRVDRRALRPARQRLHELRRDRLHARRADRPPRRAAARLRRAQRLCRRHHARPARRWTRSAASSSRSGAAGSAPARACSSRRSKAIFGPTSRYAQRLPIGTPEILQVRSRSQRLRDFYRDHYRANRMAVIVVGDIDAGRDRAADPGAVRRRWPAARRRAARSIRFRRTSDTRFVTVSDPRGAGRRRCRSSTSGRCDALDIARRLPAIAGRSLA